MKKILFILLLVCIKLTSYSQDTAAKAYYTGIVKADSISKADLYSRAKSWIASSYNSPKSVIQMEDKDAGEIVANGNFPSHEMPLGLGVHATMYVKHKLTVYVKDGKYKWEIQILGLECPDPRNGWSKDYNWYLEHQTGGLGHKAAIFEVENTEADIKSTIASLEKAMTSKTSAADF